VTSDEGLAKQIDHPSLVTYHLSRLIVFGAVVQLG
jgi:hypothetical protein